MTVDIQPLPAVYRRIPERLRPHHPPIFPDGEPNLSDRELALELWRALDPDSRRWYVGRRAAFVGLELASSDVAALRL